MDVAIVGAGVVGAAVFAELSARGRSCVVLDRRSRTGGETTERNSGVVHAGLWYPADSLKTQLCVEGNCLLYAWARTHGVAHARTGKWVVAADGDDERALDALVEHARDVGAGPVERVGGAALERRAPGVVGRAGLRVEGTGIVDPAELTASLIAAGRERGGLVVTHAEVRAVDDEGSRWRLETSRGPLIAEAVVNAAGLYADEISRLAGIPYHHVHPCRGDYYLLRGAWSFPALVYPVRKRGAAGLGVHLTVGLDGRYRLGPDAYYVAAKDDYGGQGGREVAFAAAAARILRGITTDALSYDACGIRPKLRGPEDAEERDFVVAEERRRFVNLVGIESPGLTSALAIARRVGRMLCD